MIRAFVLSGGASLGAIQAGMLEALYERDIKPDVIVGASAGALNGAYIASRPQETGTARALAGIWRELRREQLFPLAPVGSLAALLGLRDHLASDRGLRGLLERHLEFERLEDSPIPLHAVAVDARTGRELLLSEGPAVEAILASASIPGVLPPVRWGEMDLIDGGVANNTPIAHAVALGAREIYVLPTVLPTGDACALARAPRGALGAIMHAMTLLVQQRLTTDLVTFAEQADLVVLPPPCPLAIQPTDFGHAQALIDQARRKARRFLAARERDRVEPTTARGRPRAGRATAPTRTSRRAERQSHRGARTAGTGWGRRGGAAAGPARA